MVTRIVCFALIAVSASSISLGSTSRLQGLLVRGFIEDDSDMFINPALVSYYQNLLIGELGTYEIYGTGKQMGWLPDQSLAVTAGRGVLSGGLVLNRNISPVDAIADYDMRLSGYPFSDPIDPINPIEVMAAYGMNGMAVGARVYLIGGGSTDKGDEPWFNGSREYKRTRRSKLWDFGGGVAWDLGQGDKVDLYANLGLFSFNAESEDHYVDTLFDTTYTNINTDESEGGKYLTFGGRAFYSMTRRMKLVPLVEFTTMGFTEKAEVDVPFDTTYPDIDNSHTSLMAGVGVNAELSRYSTLVVAASMCYCKDKQEREDGTDETSTWTLPLLQAGLETDLTRWFTLRMGVQKAHAKVTEKSTAEGGFVLKQDWEQTRTYVDSPLDFLSLGFGVRLGKFLIDATFMEEIPFTGTYLLSGLSGNLFGKMTATYYF